jgi:lambda repressor-like predicted transcriptional regulator
MRIVALIAILGVNLRKTRATGGHSYTSLANPLSHSF